MYVHDWGKIKLKQLATAIAANGGEPRKMVFFDYDSSALAS